MTRPILQRTRRTQIRIQILRIVASGIFRPTNIMRRTSLNWTSIQKHLKFLLSEELLNVKLVNHHKIYSISEKGVLELNSTKCSLMNLKGGN